MTDSATRSSEAQREYRNPSPIFVLIIAVDELPVKGIYPF